MEPEVRELGKLQSGKPLSQYKEEISKLTGVHPIFIKIKFEENKEKTKIVDITPSITKAGVVQRALNIGLIGIEIHEVGISPQEQVQVGRKAVEIEAKAYFLPDVGKIKVLVNELLRLAIHMNEEDVGAIAMEIFRLRTFMNRAHRSTEDGSLNDRQKPYALELAITTALTRVLGDATGYGLAVLDQAGEADAATAEDAVEDEQQIETGQPAAGEGEDLAGEADTIDDPQMRRDLAMSTIRTAIQTLGWEEARAILGGTSIERQEYEEALVNVPVTTLEQHTKKLTDAINELFVEEDENGKGPDQEKDTPVP